MAEQVDVRHMKEEKNVTNGNEVVNNGIVKAMPKM